ncbi:MAG: hypothetical protein PHW04_12415 [Candidatus Wallbacteria bacterium]|nr:hypothetical protein [Candidatus Wallbacteria bacterium]
MRSILLLFFCATALFAGDELLRQADEYSSRGEDQSALSCYQQFFEEEQNPVLKCVAAQQIGRIMTMVGEISQAIFYYEYLKTNGQSVEKELALTELFQIYLSLDELDKVEVCLKSLGSSPFYARYAGQFYEKKEDPAKALENYEKFYRITRDRVMIAKITELYRKLNLLDARIESWKSESNNFPELYMYLLFTRNPEESLTFFEQMSVQQISAESADYFLTLCWQGGKLQLAERALSGLSKRTIGIGYDCLKFKQAVISQKYEQAQAVISGLLEEYDRVRKEGPQLYSSLKACVSFLKAVGNYDLATWILSGIEKRFGEQQETPEFLALASDVDGFAGWLLKKPKVSWIGILTEFRHFFSSEKWADLGSALTTGKSRSDQELSLSLEMLFDRTEWKTDLADCSRITPGIASLIGRFTEEVRIRIYEKNLEKVTKEQKIQWLLELKKFYAGLDRDQEKRYCDLLFENTNDKKYLKEKAILSYKLEGATPPADICSTAEIGRVSAFITGSYTEEVQSPAGEDEWAAASMFQTDRIKALENLRQEVATGTASNDQRRLYLFMVLRRGVNQGNGEQEKMFDRLLFLGNAGYRYFFQKEITALGDLSLDLKLLSDFYIGTAEISLEIFNCYPEPLNEFVISNLLNSGKKLSDGVIKSVVDSKQKSFYSSRLLGN